MCLILVGYQPDSDRPLVVAANRDEFHERAVQRYAGRLSAIHVKDIAMAGTNLDEDGWSDLGAGTMEWTALLQACRRASSDLIYALEHDKPGDPVGYASRSAAAFKNLWRSTND